MTDKTRLAVLEGFVKSPGWAIVVDKLKARREKINSLWMQKGISEVERVELAAEARVIDEAIRIPERERSQLATKLKREQEVQ